MFRFSIITRHSGPRERPSSIPALRRQLIKNVFERAINIKNAEEVPMVGLGRLPDIQEPPEVGHPGYLHPTVDLKKIKQIALQKECNHLFVRAPVGSGKSTIVETLARDERVVRISYSSQTEPFKRLCNAIGVERSAAGPDTVHPRLDGKLLVIDECHLAFGDPELLDCLLKAQHTSVFFVLMFSSTSAHSAAQGSNTVVLPSPAAVTNKTFIDLRFTSEDLLRIVVMSTLPKKLLKATRSFPQPNELLLQRHVAETMEQLFEGHRLLTVYALSVLTEGDLVVQNLWTCDNAWLQTFHKNLESRLLKTPSQMNECRSAIVNTNFDRLYRGHIVCHRLLCEGILYSDGPEGDALSSLLTRGALRPLKTSTTDRDAYVWSNPFVCRYFQRKFQLLQPRLKCRDSISFVLLGLTWFDVSSFFQYQSERSRKFFLQMPFEQQFSLALQSGWRHFADEVSVQKEVVYRDGCWSESQANDNKGRVDLMLTDKRSQRRTFVELVVFGKPTKERYRTRMETAVSKENVDTIRKHLEPFFTGIKNGVQGRTSYQQALKEDVVLVVFSHPDAFDDAKRRAVDELSSYGVNAKHRKLAQNMKILILSMKSMFRYNVCAIFLDKAHPKRVVVQDVEDELLSTLCGMRISDCGRHLEINQRQPTLFEYCVDNDVVRAVTKKTETTPIIDATKFVRDMHPKEMFSEHCAALSLGRATAWVRFEPPLSSADDEVTLIDDVGESVGLLRLTLQNKQLCGPNVVIQHPFTGERMAAHHELVATTASTPFVVMRPGSTDKSTKK